MKAVPRSKGLSKALPHHKSTTKSKTPSHTRPKSLPRRKLKTTQRRSNSTSIHQQHSADSTTPPPPPPPPPLPTQRQYIPQGQQQQPILPGQPHSTTTQPPTTTPSSPSQSTNPDEEEVPLPPPKYRFPVPPQKLKRLPHQSTIRDTLFNPLTHLNPNNFVYPDYALLMDFNKKESLLDWNIITDSDLNGTSEASIAWGTAKNPITGETMRTMVFQGRLGDIILPKSMINDSKAKVSFNNVLDNINSDKKQTIQAAHGKLLIDIAQNPEADYGDHNSVDQHGNSIHVPRFEGDNGETTFSQDEFGAVHGFVGLMSPAFTPALDLHWWDTFNICVRTDNGPWLASAKPITATNEELYMASVPGPDGKIVNPRKTMGFLRKPMRNLFVPIDNLSVTRAGRGSKYASVNSSHIFDSFGFSIRGPAGPFKIEIGWIAVARADGNNLQKESRLPVPEKSLTVDLSKTEIETSHTLTDQQLYLFAHQKKRSQDQLAKDKAVEHAQTNSTILSQSHPINIDEVISDRIGSNLRKAQLAAKLGVSVDQIKDLQQERPDQDDVPFDPTIQSHPDLSPRAIATISKMEKLLEVTHTRHGRVSHGLTGYNRIDPATGQNRETTVTDIDLTADTKIGSLEREIELHKLQKKAKELTGQSIPLLVPTYTDENVMVQARLQTLQSGLMTEEQWESYTTTDSNINKEKLEKDMQNLQSKLAMQEMERTYPNSAHAKQIRAATKYFDEEERAERQAKLEEDRFYNPAGQVRSNFGDDVSMYPPRDHLEIRNRAASVHHGDREDLKLAADGFPASLDNPSLNINQNQPPSRISMVTREQMQKEEAERRNHSRAPQYAQGPALDVVIHRDTLGNGGNGTKH